MRSAKKWCPGFVLSHSVRFACIGCVKSSVKSVKLYVQGPSRAVCAFPFVVPAFVCSFRGLFACVLSWVEIL